MKESGFIIVVAELPKETDRRTRLRRKDALGNPKRHQVPHLGDSLQGGRLGMGDHARMLCREKIAGREPRIVVRRADQTVEIEFLSVHIDHRPGSAPSVNPGGTLILKSALTPRRENRREIRATDDSIPIEVDRRITRPPEGEEGRQIRTGHDPVTVEITQATVAG